MVLTLLQIEIIKWKIKQRVLLFCLSTIYLTITPYDANVCDDPSIFTFDLQHLQSVDTLFQDEVPGQFGNYSKVPHLS